LASIDDEYLTVQDVGALVKSEADLRVDVSAREALSRLQLLVVVAPGLSNAFYALIIKYFEA
jgi:hypothetical protein